jgi:N-acetylglucosamine-6-phosphate deacetylase
VAPPHRPGRKRRRSPGAKPARGEIRDSGPTDPPRPKARAAPPAFRPPGLVDVQINGYRGVDFASPTLDAAQVATAFRGLLATGLVAFLPTVVTARLETYRRVLPLLAAACRSEEFRGRALGIHLEGPFISGAPGAVGCHDPTLVRAYGADGGAGGVGFLDELLALCGGGAADRGALRMMTLAADRPGAVALVRRLRSLGVVAALGHQRAAAEQLASCARAGATLLTHLGNGMPAVVPRHANAFVAGLSEPRLSASIVTDGWHLPPAAVRCVLLCKGEDGVVLTSDMAPVGGLPPGIYSCFGGVDNVRVESRKETRRAERAGALSKFEIRNVPRSPQGSESAKGSAKGSTKGSTKGSEPGSDGAGSEDEDAWPGRGPFVRAARVTSARCLAGSGSTTLQCAQHLLDLTARFGLGGRGRLADEEGRADGTDRTRAAVDLVEAAAFRNPLRLLGVEPSALAAVARREPGRITTRWEGPSSSARRGRAGPRLRLVAAEAGTCPVVPPRREDA